jgi:uncharacterized protein YjaZ
MKKFKIEVQQIRCGHMKVRAKNKQEAYQKLMDMGFYRVCIFQEDYTKRHWNFVDATEIKVKSSKN